MSPFEPSTEASPGGTSPSQTGELRLLFRLAVEVASAEGAPMAGMEHLRRVLFSKRVAVMLELARAIDALEAGEERDSLGAQLAKAEQSWRLSLTPPEGPPPQIDPPTGQG